MLHLTQPAVSHQIKQLEVINKIFYKTGRTFSLTDEEGPLALCQARLPQWENTRYALDDMRHNISR